jgi:nucleotide-binding universal stress UspA family protein
MDEIKKILAPTDLSELSSAGVRYALKLAKSLKAEVTVYHVVDFQMLTEQGQRSSAPSSFQPPDDLFLARYKAALSAFLNDYASDLTSSLNAHEKVEQGAPSEKIVELATTQAMDLIVMSTRGKGGLQASLGSVTEQVVRTAPCPVLSIRPKEPRS